MFIVASPAKWRGIGVAELFRGCLEIFRRVDGTSPNPREGPIVTQPGRMSIRSRPTFFAPGPGETRPRQSNAFYRNETTRLAQNCCRTCEKHQCSRLEVAWQLNPKVLAPSHERVSGSESAAGQKKPLRTVQPSRYSWCLECISLVSLFRNPQVSRQPPSTARKNNGLAIRKTTTRQDTSPRGIGSQEWK